MPRSAYTRKSRTNAYNTVTLGTRLDGLRNRMQHCIRSTLAIVCKVAYIPGMARIPKRQANKDGDSRLIAVVYCRVSTEEQAAEGVSLQQQQEAGTLYAKSRGFTLQGGGPPVATGVLVERGVSGGTPLIDRPEGRKLAAMIRSGKVGHVIATKLDRLFRSAADSAAWVAELDKYGVSLHLLDLGGSAVDTSTTSGRLVVGVLSQVAEMVRGTIKDNTRNAMRFKASRLEYCGGDAPYGYRIADPKADPIMLVEVQAEQHAIQLARELRRSGLSYRKIGDVMHRGSVRPRGGGPWPVETIRRMTWQEGRK